MPTGCAVRLFLGYALRCAVRLASPWQLIKISGGSASFLLFGNQPERQSLSAHRGGKPRKPGGKPLSPIASRLACWQSASAGQDVSVQKLIPNAQISNPFEPFSIPDLRFPVPDGRYSLPIWTKSNDERRRGKIMPVSVART